MAFGGVSCTSLQMRPPPADRSAEYQHGWVDAFHLALGEFTDFLRGGKLCPHAWNFTHKTAASCLVLQGVPPMAREMPRKEPAARGTLPGMVVLFSEAIRCQNMLDRLHRRIFRELGTSCTDQANEAKQLGLDE
eukprot:3564338-Amphidinium_carterae.1